MNWNWSWNGGDPYMRGWGLFIMLGIYLVIFSPVIVLMMRERRREHRR